MPHICTSSKAPARPATPMTAITRIDATYMIKIQAHQNQAAANFTGVEGSLPRRRDRSRAR